MDIDWNFGADVAAPSNGAQQQQNQGDPSLMDYPKALGGAGAKLVGTLEAGARAGSEATDSPNAAAIWHYLQASANQVSDDAYKSMTPAAQASIHAAVTDPAFWHHPLSASALQAIDMTPSLAATIAPAVLVSPLDIPTGGVASGAAVAASGAVLGASQAASDIYDKTDQMSDDEFQKQYPYYAKLRASGMDEDTARAKANQQLMGFKPVAEAVANAGAMLLGPAGRVAGLVPEAAGAGLLKRAAVGAGEAGLGMAGMTGVSEAANQQTDIELDKRTQFDPSQIAAAMLNSGIVGGAMGAVGGALTPHPVDTSPDLRRPAIDKRIEQTDSRSADEAQTAALNAEQTTTTTPATTRPPVNATTETTDANSNTGSVNGADTAGSSQVTPATAQNDQGQTVPEAAETLAAQRQQLIDGQRKAMLYPKGPGTKPTPPDGMKIVNTKDGVIHYNPALAKPKDIYDASKAGRLNDILGLGDFSKQDVAARVAQGEPMVAVTERQPDGTEVKAAAGTPSTAPAQAESLEASKTPGNQIRVEPPERVIADRQDAAVKPAEELPAKVTPEPKLNPGIEDKLNSLREAYARQEALGNAPAGSTDAFVARKRAELYGKQNAPETNKPKGPARVRDNLDDRKLNNDRATAIANAFKPTEDEVAKAGTAEGRKMTVDRMNQMVAAASDPAKGISFPDRFRSATKNVDMNHNENVVLLMEARSAMRRAADNKLGLQKHAELLTRERLLRSGDKEAIAQSIRDRRDEGNQAFKRSGKGDSDVAAHEEVADELGLPEGETNEGVTNEAEHPEVAKEETQDEGTQAASEGKEPGQGPGQGQGRSERQYLSREMKSSLEQIMPGELNLEPSK